jgi:hypothetical protein
MESLRQADRIGSLAAMDAAQATLRQAALDQVSQDWRARVFELAEALYQSIRLQLSVPRYQASAVRRGANLDTIDVPLNNNPWMLYRFGELRRLADENERLKGIAEIVNWTNPGPGGFYDDLGDPSSQPHLVRGLRYEEDPGFLRSPLVNYVIPSTDPTWPWSWRNLVEALYDAPIHLRYTDLDPAARYRVRIVYAGEESPNAIRLVADDQFEIHPFRKKDWPARPIEFDVPEEATQDGELNLKWYRTPGLARGTNCQVSEVWLIKR